MGGYCCGACKKNGRSHGPACEGLTAGGGYEEVPEVPVAAAETEVPGASGALFMIRARGGIAKGTEFGPFRVLTQEDGSMCLQCVQIKFGQITSGEDGGTASYVLARGNSKKMVNVGKEVQPGH